MILPFQLASIPSWTGSMFSLVLNPSISSRPVLDPLVSSRSVLDPLVSSLSRSLFVATLFPVGIFLELVCRSRREAKGDDKKEKRERENGERKKTERGVGRPERRGQATSTLIGFYS